MKILASFLTQSGGGFVVRSLAWSFGLRREVSGGRFADGPSGGGRGRGDGGGLDDGRRCDQLCRSCEREKVICVELVLSYVYS